MSELRDSSHLVEDWEALRSLVRAEGYVFFRGLGDRELALEAGRVGAACLQQTGWLTPQGAIASPLHATEQEKAWLDPGFRAFATSAAFNRLPYQPPVRRMMQRLMGNSAFSYPLKVVRVVYPASLRPVHGGNYIHQDYPVIGVPDMFTMWMPMMDIPRDLGGLCIRPGSQSQGLVRPSVIDPTDPSWATTDYRAGDVLVFHCLTVHAALPNRTDRLRLSGEARWQLADDPVPARLVFGPNRATGVELFSRLFNRTDWWAPVPAGLRIVDAPAHPHVTGIPASRYVDAPARPAGGGGMRYDVVPH
jgi:hypothetical protein